MRPYAGSLPSFLYRFRSVTEERLQHFVSEVERLEIYLSSPADFNDPEEGRVDFRFLGKRADVVDLLQQIYRAKRPTACEAEVVAFSAAAYEDLRAHGFAMPNAMAEQFYRQAAKLIRVACLSEDPLNPMMWSHYAAYRSDSSEPLAHGGVCLQYAIDDSWRPMLRPVSYSDRRPVVNRLKVADPSDPLFVKGLAWAGEKEWRIVQFFGAEHVDHPALADHSKVVVSPETLTGIVFGLNTPDSLKVRCRELIARREERPSLYQISRQPMSFNLQMTLVT